MSHQSTIWTATVAAVLASAIVGAHAAEDAKYPDWRGQWVRIGGGGQFDPDKPPGRGQQPPLTAEYQAIWEAHLKESAAGGQNYNTQVRCLPGGMPRMMMAYDPMEVTVTPEITFLVVSFNNEYRRIYTDGRRRPANAEPSYSGYSIGRWIDEDGDGHYDALEIETRNLKGPRIFDGTGIPMHEDNQTVIEERMHLDKSDPNVLRDEITTVDHALTRPWTVSRAYRRDRTAPWIENVCAEGNQYVFIGDETYMVSLDGFLMPTKKDQPAPNLKYFNQTRK